MLFTIEAETERRNEQRKHSRVIFEESGKYEVKDQRMTVKPLWDEEDTTSKAYNVIIEVSKPILRSKVKSQRSEVKDQISEVKD